MACDTTASCEDLFDLPKYLLLHPGCDVSETKRIADMCMQNPTMKSISTSQPTQESIMSLLKDLLKEFGMWGNLSVAETAQRYVNVLYKCTVHIMEVIRDSAQKFQRIMYKLGRLGGKIATNAGVKVPEILSEASTLSQSALVRTIDWMCTSWVSRGIACIGITSFAVESCINPDSSISERKNVFASVFYQSISFMLGLLEGLIGKTLVSSMRFIFRESLDSIMSAFASIDFHIKQACGTVAWARSKMKSPTKKLPDSPNEVLPTSII